MEGFVSNPFSIIKIRLQESTHSLGSLDELHKLITNEGMARLALGYRVVMLSVTTGNAVQISIYDIFKADLPKRWLVGEITQNA